MTTSVTRAPDFASSSSISMGSGADHGEVQHELIPQPLMPIEELAICNSDFHPQRVGLPSCLDVWLDRRGVFHVDGEAISEEKSSRGGVKYLAGSQHGSPLYQGMGA